MSLLIHALKHWPPRWWYLEQIRCRRGPEGCLFKERNSPDPPLSQPCEHRSRKSACTPGSWFSPDTECGGPRACNPYPPGPRNQCLPFKSQSRLFPYGSLTRVRRTKTPFPLGAAKAPRNAQGLGQHLQERVSDRNQQMSQWRRSEDPPSTVQAEPMYFLGSVL